MNNAPEKFLSLYMPEFAANALDNITNTDSGAKAVEWLLNKLPGKGGKRYASFLHVGKSSSQMDVFRDLLEQYSDSSMKITALSLYMEKLGAGRSITGFEGQLEGIIEVKKRYPERLIAFFGLDPRWKATGNEIAETIKNYFNNKIEISANTESIFPFSGIKLYPSTGYYAFDEKLKPSFDWAAENNVPIMTHCSYLGGIFNNNRDFLLANLKAVNPYTGQIHPAPRTDHKLENKIFKRLLNTQKAANNQIYSSYFLEPFSYKKMIEHYCSINLPLKICFAHFGGNEHMKLQYKIEKQQKNDPGNYYSVEHSKNWCAQIQELLKLPGVYTDVSYSLTDHDTHAFIFHEMQNKSYRERILFGTDFFMTERVAKEKDTYNLFREKAMAVQVTKSNGVVTNAWQMMASENVENYLKGKYY
jgi:predicted TIM-barrel fold metal-dependent hydrolase